MLSFGHITKRVVFKSMCMTLALNRPIHADIKQFVIAIRVCVIRAHVARRIANLIVCMAVQHMHYVRQ
ncbi:hypothetical protein BpHYR1_050416 [Brachionus plicatilis]|uniref:Uncharacterized protein n=1 Tax=Brachionus plicatilis TaxID=10195 RepID=A0A3M7RLX7_BRAPC|nr:hypothetical protein BpHYR1_050416 [Brachionus plicatilis]